MSDNKALLHVCCGPCLIYPIDKLKSEGYEVTAFFYNPNIYPLHEHTRRLQTLSDYADQISCELIIEAGYEDELFLETIGADVQSPKRCQKCWNLRLYKTATQAKQRGFDIFSSTLMVSPYQDIYKIKEIAEKISAEVGIDFYFDNFRRGYQEAVKVSKEKNMYRQNYCGCKFSLQETNDRKNDRKQETKDQE